MIKEPAPPDGYRIVHYDYGFTRNVSWSDLVQYLQDQRYSIAEGCAVVTTPFSISETAIFSHVDFYSASGALLFIAIAEYRPCTPTELLLQDSRTDRSGQE